jgi:hypothetical protein
MKRILPIALLFVTSWAFAQTKETRNVGTFTKVSFRFPGKLILKQGSPQSVVLEGDKETLSKIETDVEGNKLVIGREGKWGWGDWSWGREDHRITAYVTVKDIEGLSVSGSGELVTEGKITSRKLDLSVSGSGQLHVDATVENELETSVSGSGRLEVSGSCRSFDASVSGSGRIVTSTNITGRAEVSVSGSGKVEASGKANEIEAHISGSGKILAANLEVDKCEVRISGSGDVEINVKSDLDANISGSGSVTYKGNPTHVNSHASGSGHVKKM